MQTGVQYLTCSGSLYSDEPAVMVELFIAVVLGAGVYCLLLPGYGGGGLSGSKSEFVEAVLIILHGDWLVVRDTGESDRVSREPTLGDRFFLIQV